MYRLPANLGSLVPPPGDQTSAPRSALTHPWRGSFLVRGLRTSDTAASVEIKVTSVETDGDNKVEAWPANLIFSIAPPYDLHILQELENYVRQDRQRPPICTFLPARQRDPHQNYSNEANFKNLSTTLINRQTVALAPLSDASSPGIPNPLPTTGILIFPSSHSPTLLVGAIFMGGTPFPDFVLSALRRARGDLPPITTSAHSQNIPISRSGRQSVMHSSGSAYSHDMYTTSSLRYQSASLSPISPVEYGERGQSSYLPYGEHAVPRISSHSHHQDQQYSQLISPAYPVSPNSAGYHAIPSPYRSEPYSQSRSGGLNWGVKEETDDPSQQNGVSGSRYV